MADRLSITFGAYLTGGVPDGMPLWREPPVKPDTLSPVPEGTGTEAEPDPSPAPAKDTQTQGMR